MHSFAQRLGYVPIKDILQKEKADEELKVDVWNFLLSIFFVNPSMSWSYEPPFLREILINIWTTFFKKNADEILPPKHVVGTIKVYIFDDIWYNVYNILEFVLNTYQVQMLDNITITRYTNSINSILKRNLSAYRLINLQFLEISSNEEIETLQSALEISDTYSNVKSHLQTSIKLLSNKINPDFRNSIKESISAVESLCQVITGEKNATLGQALSTLEKNGIIHKALKNSFTSLYGFTSDAAGIRHALTDSDETVGQDEAIYFLVSCSAFINFLVKKCG